MPRRERRQEAVLLTAPPTLLLTERGPLLACYAVGLFATSYGGVVYDVTQVSFRQAICPDRLLGRMNASIRFLVWATMPLGGVLGNVLGLRATALGAVPGCALAPIWLLASPLRRMRDLPADVPA